jgi:hypothetical protein
MAERETKQPDGGGDGSGDKSEEAGGKVIELRRSETQEVTSPVRGAS